MNLVLEHKYEDKDFDVNKPVISTDLVQIKRLRFKIVTTMQYWIYYWLMNIEKTAPVLVFIGAAQYHGCH